MYTQCPECGVAFRVTAEVLKMAAGRVRCGGCGVAFNALEHLSETRPPAPATTDNASDPGLPEMPPESPPELEPDSPPESISAEQSAALLKTLDELAGEDIRIEDTGVEWRVISESESEPEARSAEESDDEPSRVIDEMLFDDNTVLPDDFDAVVEAPSQPRPEQPRAEEQPDVPEPPQFDLDLSDPDEWDDLLGEVDEILKPADDIDEPVAADDGVFEAQSEPPDTDTQFAIQAEAMGIDTTGAHELIEDEADEPDEVDELERSIEEDLFAAAFETEAAARELGEAEAAADVEDDIADDEREEVEIDLQIEDEIETEDDVDDIALRFDDKVEDDIATLSMSMDDEPDDEPAAEEQAAEPDDEPEATDDIPTPSDEPAAAEHVIPEMTEEEKTINMMIDEELLAIAVEDEDGFASTIVQIQPDDKVEKEIADKESSKARDKADKKEKKKKDKAGKKKDKDKSKDKRKDAEPAVAVETIIMEGDFVRAELDKERLAADKAATSGGNGVSISLNREKDDYERRKEMTWSGAGPGSYAGVAALVLLLLMQFVHQSRESLATVPAFNATVGPMYRMLGQPLTPTWDIGGWRFEATKGDTDESEEVLTIYSRVGNNSDESLPYPLVHLSLTDRFDDIIGSAVLEPVEYLPESSDPGQLVPPGNTFNAVIAIDSPSQEATGFKLNVCYRLASGQLRCADQDFK